MDRFSLRGKVALITGGRAMYGRACSMALAEAGARLYLATHSPERVAATVSELRARGGDVDWIELHQEEPASIRAMVETLVEKEGRIDVFVNASRVIPQTAPGWMQEEAGLREAVRVNSAGFLYMSMLVAEVMKRRGSGSIINFGSMMGLVGVERHNYEGEPAMQAGAYAHDYALNKSAITSWTRHAAGYLGRCGVRVNAICPGGLRSERTPERFAENYGRHTQLGRLAEEDDVKGLVLLLASDAAAYITGLSIPLDGGYTAL